MKNFALNILLIMALFACKRPDNNAIIKDENKPFIGTWIGRNNIFPLVDTITFSENQSFSTLSHVNYKYYSINSVDSISFGMDTSSSFVSYSYTFRDKELIIKCWFKSVVDDDCYEAIFSKQ